VRPVVKSHLNQPALAPKNSRRGLTAILSSYGALIDLFLLAPPVRILNLNLAVYIEDKNDPESILSVSMYEICLWMALAYRMTGNFTIIRIGLIDSDTALSIILLDDLYLLFRNIFN
jgi:hypothetical protein